MIPGKLVEQVTHFWLYKQGSLNGIKVLKFLLLLLED